MGELKRSVRRHHFSTRRRHPEKKKPIHTLRRLTEYTTYYEISLEEGKKNEMIKKEIRMLFLRPKIASSL